MPRKFITSESRLTQKREEVRKASRRKGSKALRDHRRLQAIAEAMASSVSVSLSRGLQKFKRKVDEGEIERLFEEGKFDDIVETIPWDELPEDLKGFDKNYEKAYMNGSEAGIASIPSPPSNLTVTASSPGVVRFIENQTGNLIQNVTDDAKRSVRAAVQGSFEVAATPKQVARTVAQSIGPSEKQTNQVMRLQQKERLERASLEKRLKDLKAEGKGQTFTARKVKGKLSTLSEDKIQKRVEQRLNNYRKNRSRTIARTEMTNAVNAGQEETWVEAMNRGLISPQTAFKEWVTVPDEDRTEICTELDGQRVPLDGEFYSSVAGKSFSRPAAHYNCRSSVVLVFE